MINKEDLELSLLVLGLMYINEKLEDYLSESQINRLESLNKKEINDKDDYSEEAIRLTKEILKDK